MKLKLLRLGKAVCKGPLVDPVLMPKHPWPIGQARVIDDSIAHQLLAKYPAMFRVMRAEDRILDKMGEKPKNKLQEDTILRPKGAS